VIVGRHKNRTLGQLYLAGGLRDPFPRGRDAREYAVFVHKFDAHQISPDILKWLFIKQALAADFLIIARMR
jgi:hypothetical protein